MYLCVRAASSKDLPICGTGVQLCVASDLGGCSSENCNIFGVLVCFCFGLMATPFVVYDTDMVACMYVCTNVSWRKTSKRNLRYTSTYESREQKSLKKLWEY